MPVTWSSRASVVEGGKANRGGDVSRVNLYMFMCKMQDEKLFPLCRGLRGFCAFFGLDLE